MNSAIKVHGNRTLWSYTFIQDRIVRPCTQINVSLDIRYLERRFFVWFSVWSYMIMYDIGLRSDTIAQGSVIDLTIRFLDLWYFLLTNHYTSVFRWFNISYIISYASVDIVFENLTIINEAISNSTIIDQTVLNIIW